MGCVQKFRQNNASIVQKIAERVPHGTNGRVTYELYGTNGKVTHGLYEPYVESVHVTTGQVKVSWLGLAVDVEGRV